jgi:DNA-binding transcriptional LysR family regulator
MELRRLRYFVAVAETMNFHRAAELLDISQPSLSQHICALEADLHVTLFNRTKRRIGLTNAGSDFLASALAVVGQFDSAAERAREAQAGMRGTLTIGGNGTVMFDRVPLIVEAFRARFPRVVVRILMLRNMDVVDALRMRRIQLGFANVIQVDDDITSQFLWAYPSRLVLPTDHSLARKRSVRLADIENETVLLRADHASAATREILALFQEQRFVPRFTRNVSPINDLETLLGLVACGLGVTILPSSFEHVCPDAVVFKPIAGTKRDLRISACWHKYEPNPLVRNFLALSGELASSSMPA